MKIYLVRHGQTDCNRDDILMGQLDIPLNQTGKNQAESLAKTLKNIKLDICYVSPLTRTKQTAKIICHDKIRIIEEPLLKERDIGPYEGKSMSEVDLNNYTKDKGVESDRQLFNRARECAEKLKNSNFENILVVSHNGFLKNLLHILKNGTFETFNWQDQVELDNGSVRIVEL